jgi:hypothetical protein
MSKIFFLSMCDAKVSLKTVMTHDLVQALLKKWWVESDFKAPNFPLSLRLKVSAVTITVFITILEQNR